MSKRRQRQDSNCVKRPRPKRSWRHKHLYVILNDFENGYSIHKLDMGCNFYGSDDEESDSDQSDHAANLRGLPKPPALRLGQACHENMFFAAVGSNIFMANNMAYHAQPPALLYVTQTATLNMGPRIPLNLRPSIAVALPAGEGGVDEMQPQKLYVLSGECHGKQLGMQVSFQVMSWVRTVEDIELGPFQPSHMWSWESIPTPPAPFDLKRESVASFVVHPDGHTIFFSTQEPYNQHCDIGTYSFNTRDLEWRSHGEWVLPFHNQGYYDKELDAWVGLAGDGYVCSCRVASRSGSMQGALDMKMTKHKLLHEVGTDRRRHLGASLTYMGNSRFCIVEVVARDGVELRNAIRGANDSCVLHVTVFGLKYNYKGDLETTICRTTDSYAVSKNIMGYSPVAFWM